MSPKKKMLDAETKAIRRQEALQRYARNVHSQPRTQKQQEGQLASATKYCDQNCKSIRAADALRRAEKCIEKDGVEAYDELVQRPHMARTQRKHEGHPPSPRPCSLHMLLFYESESEGKDSESDDDGPIPGADFYHAPRPRSPTPPDLDCDCRLPAFCPKCTYGCDNTTHFIEYFHCNPGNFSSESFAAEARSGSHNLKLASSKRVCSVQFEQALTPLARVNCVPEFYPHPTKHTYSVRAHGQAADCMFYAILDREDYGIYNDFSQIAAILEQDPGILYVSDKHWIGITTKWRKNCEQHHEHPLMQSRSRSSSPLDSASAFNTDSPHPSPPCTPSPQPSPCKGAAQTSSRSPSKAPTEQAAGSRTHAPLSLRFPRPVYPETPTLLPYPARREVAYAVSMHNLVFKSSDDAFKLFEHTDGADLILTHSHAEVESFFLGPSPSLASIKMYAVGGHHKVFKKREDVWALFLETNSSVMLFARSSGEVKGFIHKHALM
ncbi:hypothetical protein C8R44DRAFT_733837 [Mycena epipterygia]|nr:hypothetical protein C8R44DRAFT_733837 [Mycena epipterygia]